MHLFMSKDEDLQDHDAAAIQDTKLSYQKEPFRQIAIHC
jgi:hypothetical protein